MKKKILKYLFKMPIYVLFAVSLMGASFLAYDLNNRRYNCNSNISSVKVQPVIIIGKTDIYAKNPIDSFTLYELFQKQKEVSANMWLDMSGIKLEWLPDKVIEREEWGTIYATPYGSGEVDEVVESLYEEYPIILFVEDIITSDQDPSCFGVAGWGRLGAAVEYYSGPKIITHELGHVLGLYHFQFPDNIMYPDGDASECSFDKSQLGKMKRKIEKKDWD